MLDHGEDQPVDHAGITGGGSESVTRVIQVGPPVVTEVRAGKGWGTHLDRIPFPEGALYTLDVVAMAFGVAVKTVRNELSERRDFMDKPMYRLDRQHRLRRLITGRDFQTLRTVFTVRVKK